MDSINNLRSLYFNSWEFNSAKIISKLAELVIKDGGRVRPGTDVIVHNKVRKDITPVVTSYTNYISFVIGETYYYYQTNDNPFFDFWYLKHKIVEGKIPRNGYIQDDKKYWMLNVHIKHECSDNDVLDAAIEIFEMLKKSTYSKSGDWAYVDVPNTHSDGFHKEKIWKCEMRKIDF